MKPYIMNYSEKFELLSSPAAHCVDTTTLTFTVENQDQDELHLDWTIQTNTTEPSDNDSIQYLDETEVTKTLEATDRDELHLDSTIETRVIEPSDHDAMYLDYTMMTKSIEGSDPDEILLSH